MATPTQAVCQCEEGFILGIDGHSCNDVDECLEDRCSQNCVNTPGSFVCTCLADYIMKNDRVTCKAKGAIGNKIKCFRVSPSSKTFML